MSLLIIQYSIKCLKSIKTKQSNKIKYQAIEVMNEWIDATMFSFYYNFHFFVFTRLVYFYLFKEFYFKKNENEKYGKTCFKHKTRKIAMFLANKLVLHMNSDSRRNFFFLLSINLKSLTYIKRVKWITAQSIRNDLFGILIE